MENNDYLTKQLITYIGNKRKLLSFIEEGIQHALTQLGKDKADILDAFAGSGIVSRYLKRFSNTLHSNDFEYYSYIINLCYLTNFSDTPEDLANIIDNLNSQKLNRHNNGIIESLYSPTDDNNIKLNERAFYTNQNARIIDNIRTMIGDLPDQYYPFCVAPLLSEASICVNTSGVFKGFYKNSKTKTGQWGGNAGNCLSRIKREIVLPVPVFSRYDCDVNVYNQDIVKLIKTLPEVDIAYLDPPYNQHPYGSNYFMLNVIAKYETPQQISKVSGIPKNWQRSTFNKYNSAVMSFNSLIKNINAKFVLISYNNEGIIPISQIDKILNKYGKVTLLSSDYDTFKGSRNLKQRSNKVKEMLFILNKT